jgi:hypothetical protein
MLLGPPKSRAGRRIVGIPEVIVPALREHLAVFAEDDPGALQPPQRCADLRRRTSLASEAIESSRSMGDLHRRPTVGILRRKGSEPIKLGGTVGTTGYCAQDAEHYV